MRDANGPRDLLRAGVLDAELAGLLWLLLDSRTPLVVVSRSDEAARLVADGLAGLLAAGARLVEVAPDDDFGWLPQASALGWRTERDGPLPPPLDAADGVLVAPRLASADGIAGQRAHLVVRALAVGYGLLATMHGDGLDDAFNALHDPAVGTDPDERSRLGVVLAVTVDAGVTRVTAAHYVRPVALDTHGHVQRLPPAVLATWNAAAGRWDQFAWGVAPDLAGRLGIRPIDVERETARRALDLSELAADPA